MTFGHYGRTPKGTPKGSSDRWSHPVAMLLLLRKKRGKKPGMRRTYFRTGPLPVTWLCHFWSKGPTRADIAQLSVAHAQNILPDTWLTSLPVTWLPVAPHSTSANNNWAVPIYYLHISHQDFLDRRFLLTSKLLKYEFQEVKLKSSLPKFICVTVKSW